MEGLIVLIAVLVVPAIVAAVSIWRGYVLSILWGWFAVPVFGLPLLTIPAAIGIALITGMLTSHGSTPKETVSGWVVLASSAITPAVTLLIGWIVTKFV